MSGIVVVSHSRALAHAAVTLAQEMVPGRPVRIEVAAAAGARVVVGIAGKDAPSKSMSSTPS